MTATERPDLIDTAPEIRGANELRHSFERRDEPGGYGTFRASGAGYTVDTLSYSRDVRVVRLHKWGTDTGTTLGVFGDHDTGTAEFRRIAAELRQREIVRQMYDALTGANVIPSHFVPALRTGDFDSLGVAADYCDDVDAHESANVLRAAWAQATGQFNHTTTTGRKTWRVLAPRQITPKHKPTPGSGATTERRTIASGRKGGMKMAPAGLAAHGRWLPIPVLSGDVRNGHPRDRPRRRPSGSRTTSSPGRSSKSSGSIAANIDCGGAGHLPIRGWRIGCFRVRRRGSSWKSPLNRPATCEPP